jgi:hypothetical protein
LIDAGFLGFDREISGKNEIKSGIARRPVSGREQAAADEK